MIQVSDEFRQTMGQRRSFKARAEVTLADGTELAFGDDDLVIGGTGVTDGAGVSVLPLGQAVCRTVRMEIINTDGRLDEYDFYGAEIRLWLSFALSESVEEIPLGIFTVTEPETGGETVTVNAADAMTRADKTYERGPGREVALLELWLDVCGQCGIPAGTRAFLNQDLSVTVPEEESTCRQMLGYIAMLAGGNARVNRQGEAEILTYAPLGPSGKPYELDAWSALSVDTDSVTVTGLRAGSGEEAVLEGAEGYVLQVENPLIEGRETEALRRMGTALIGLTVRRFEGEHVSCPLPEFMDVVLLRDRRGREYTTVLTDVSFTFGGFTAFSNSAEDAVRNASRYTSQASKVRTEAQKMVQQEKTERQRAIEEEQIARGELARQLQERMDKAGGLYCTVQRQADGSGIYYMHDKPALADSAVVMKLTADVIGFSADGGKTYPYGFTVTGEMVMGVIESEGVSADWVNAGTLNLSLMKLMGTLCGLMQGAGKNKDGQTTTGIVMFGNGENSDGSAKPPFLIVTSSGIRVQDTDDTCAYLSGGALTLECAFRPYRGKAYRYLDWVTVTGTDGNTYQALCGFNSPH